MSQVKPWFVASIQKLLLLVAVVVAAPGVSVAQQTGVMLSGPGGNTYFTQIQSGSFNATGSLPPGLVTMHIWAFGGPYDHSVHLQLSNAPLAMSMLRNAGVCTRGNGYVYNSDPTYVAFANGSLSMADSAFYNCPPVPSGGIILESGESNISHWYSQAARTVDVSAASTGQSSVIVNPGCVACGQLTYDIHIDLSLPPGTTYSISGTSDMATSTGNTQSSPHSPTSEGTSGGFRFDQPVSSHWYDPPAVPGYYFQCGPGGSFQRIDSLPVGIDTDGLFVIQTSCGVFTALEGTGIDFQSVCGGAVSWFAVTGIDATQNYGSPTAFPIQLSFAGSPTYFDMLPLGGSIGANTCPGDGIAAPCPCGNNGSSEHGCANSAFPTGALLSATGTALLAFDSVTLAAEGMTGAICIFFQGDAQQAPVVVDDGLGCVNGTVVRLGMKSVAANASTYPQTGDPSISVRGAIPAVGGTRYYQCFYRNAVAAFCPPATSNRTNGVAITWTP